MMMLAGVFDDKGDTNKRKKTITFMVSARVKDQAVSPRRKLIFAQQVNHAPIGIGGAGPQLFKGA